MNEKNIEYSSPRLVDVGDLVDLTAGGPHIFCDGKSGNVGNLGGPPGNHLPPCST